MSKRYSELQAEHKEWPERLVALDDAYAAVANKGDKGKESVKSEL